MDEFVRVSADPTLIVIEEKEDAEEMRELSTTMLPDTAIEQPFDGAHDSTEEGSTQRLLNARVEGSAKVPLNVQFKPNAQLGYRQRPSHAQP